VKKAMRNAQNKKRVQAKEEGKKKLREESIKIAHQEYIEVAKCYLSKSNFTLGMLEKQELDSLQDITLIESIRGFIHHAERQINQIERRVLHGEIIPHAEKVFSIFQPHTEWISKGKAGVPVELGVKVCVMEDQYQFILHHHVMEKQTDDEVAIFMVEETKKRFPDFRMCSFDKGFHSKNIQEELAKLLEQVVLPRKGKLSKQAQEIEGSKEFRQARHKHSAVESAINALEVHGLDRCPDHGVEGFKRYIALAVVARNIQRIGSILEQQEKEREERKRRKLKKFNALKIAA
jgi:transposase, IS5 family